MAINTDINEALLQDLLAIYTQAENQMLEKVAKRVKKGITDEGWNEEKLRDVHELRNEISALLTNKSKLAKTKIGQGILKAYKEGVNSAERDAGKPQTIMKDLNVPLTIQNVLLTNYNLIDDGNSKILRNVDDAYREVMAETATGLLSGVDTRRQASQKMMDKLAAKGITSFTDKAGRRWQMDSYVEMAMRTASAHAAIEGHIQTQESFGMDLMKVSSIGTTCPICAKWQGVVLSISGKTPGYHTVDEARADGLFHPNCKHTIIMFDPEIDGEGQREPNGEAVIEKATARYDLIQSQRNNERNIRYWKRREAASIDPKAKEKAHEKVKAWQHRNLLHCEKNNLRRNYAREGIRGPKSTDPNMLVGGHLSEYVQMYKDVVGEDPKKAYNVAKKFLSEDSQGFVKWVREEIKSLENIDIERAQMKDPNNKAITPTSLYKKYIGDNPMQDYASVAPYEKGSKEYKSGYAKWLKEQIEGIGTTYKVKPTTPEVIQIPTEDHGLSATNLYKKYFNQAPTEAFKQAGGEEGTGMKYGKWIETQKKNMIANGIPKTPGTTPTPVTPKPAFENTAIQKTQKVVEKAEKVIKEAKKAGVESKGKEAIANIEDEKERKKAVLKEADDIFNEIIEDPDFAIETLKDHGIDPKDVVDPKGPPGNYSKEKLANTLAKVYDVKENDFPGTTKWRAKLDKSLRKQSERLNSNSFEEKDYAGIVGVLSEKYPPTYQLAFEKTLRDLRGFQVDSSDKDAAYYTAANKTVTINVKGERKSTNVKSAYQVFFHEMGHAIDDKYGGTASSKLSANRELLLAMEKDRAILSENDLRAIPKKGDPREHLPSKVWQKLVDYDDSTGSICSGVHDSLGGLGFNRSHPVGKLLWGHAEKYWDRGNRYREVTSETFAHVMEAYACGNIGDDGKSSYDDVMRDIFPNFTAATRKILAERVLAKI